MTSNSLISRMPREVASFHTDIFDFLCTYHRVKRIPPKDTNPGAITADNGLSDEQRGELINRSLYKILNEIELRVGVLPTVSESVTSGYYDEWTYLTWTLLSIVNRLQLDTEASRAFLDYGGKHFQEKINTALVDLVNKAQRMQPPEGVQQIDVNFERFYQSYVLTLISLHHLMNHQSVNPSQQQQKNDQFSEHSKWTIYQEFESQVTLLKDQITTCIQYQREFCNNHSYILWRKMRESQIQKMRQYGHENKGFAEAIISFYSNILYNLGVLAARLQGFWYELKSSKLFLDKPDLIAPLLKMVYTMVEVLLSDAIICVEPSQNAILVTNNLFPMKIISLCRSVFFKDFSLQIVSEEVAQQIQQEIRHCKTFEPLVPIRPFASAALLAMKPSSGVKRNNATASAEGGNTAHKKSDVNSKEWITIPPSFDSDHQGWGATYPHLLCTTRQKDTLLDNRSAGQTGKRPLFYFHVKTEMFSFSGTYSMAHSLSLPFTIATRRNQDCQVQRMMSSYTATCFWLYGTNVLDGLMIQWYDNDIEWKHFKLLYAQHFALNAEVSRLLSNEDFNILKQKLHCSECADNKAVDDKEFSSVSHNQQQQQRYKNEEFNSLTVTFKNVLCPHLHYVAGKTDLRFSIWRGMLELLHLFSDQRTDVKFLWENGLLQGFMELETVNTRLQVVESGLIMRLSFVIGCCVCFSVKTAGQILNLEPLDIRRLQAKSLHEYLRDILVAEKVKYVLNSNYKWIHVKEVIKMCQKTNNADSYNVFSKEITSNSMCPGCVKSEQTFRFTPMRVAVVTCNEANLLTEENENQKAISTSTSSRLMMIDNTGGDNAVNTNEKMFAESVEALLQAYGKSANDLIDLLQRYHGVNPYPTAQHRNDNSTSYQTHQFSHQQQQKPQSQLKQHQQVANNILNKQNLQLASYQTSKLLPSGLFNDIVGNSGLVASNSITTVQPHLSTIVSQPSTSFSSLHLTGTNSITSSFSSTPFSTNLNLLNLPCYSSPSTSSSSGSASVVNSMNYNSQQQKHTHQQQLEQPSQCQCVNHKAHYLQEMLLQSDHSYEHITRKNNSESVPSTIGSGNNNQESLNFRLPVLPSGQFLAKESSNINLLSKNRQIFSDQLPYHHHHSQNCVQNWNIDCQVNPLLNQPICTNLSVEFFPDNVLSSFDKSDHTLTPLNIPNSM